MKYTIKIHKISTVDELSDAWKIEDFKELLKRFDFENDGVNDIKELKELLFMAITDKEPNEAAAILLDYSLSDHLNENQIEFLKNILKLVYINRYLTSISYCTKLLTVSFRIQKQLL